ncbi:MAG: hypothetical protein V1886_00025 [archaeon]
MASLKEIIGVAVHNYLVKTRPNAIVEGTYRDEWHRLRFLTTRLNIDKETSVLGEYSYTYQLYGRTKDFEEIQTGKEYGKQQQIGSFVFRMERPRTIVLKDGRVFVDEVMMKEQGYVNNCVPIILKQAKNIFKKDLIYRIKTALQN